MVLSDHGARGIEGEIHLNRLPCYLYLGDSVVVMNSPVYSVIIPVYSEEEVISTLISQLCTVMESLGKPYEILIIDDGSSDRTWELLKIASEKYPSVIGYRLNRNFGHQAAVYAGLHLAKGEAVGVMDGDGQDPPEVLGEMFRRWEEGYDVAYAVRRKRKENFFKRFCYFSFYRVFYRLATIDIPLDSGDFSVMDYRVVDFITSVTDANPFIRGYRSWYGGKQIAVEYERKARQGGKTKYSWFKLINLAITGITSFSKLPLRLATYIGGLTSLLAFFYAVFVILRKLIFDFPPYGVTTGWSSLITLVAFLGGLNIFLIGVVGEYIAHIFDATKKRPVYIVRESTNKRDYMVIGLPGASVRHGNK